MQANDEDKTIMMMDKIASMETALVAMSRKIDQLEAEKNTEESQIQLLQVKLNEFEHHKAGFEPSDQMNIQLDSKLANLKDSISSLMTKPREGELTQISSLHKNKALESIAQLKNILKKHHLKPKKNEGEEEGEEADDSHHKEAEKSQKKIDDEDKDDEEDEENGDPEDGVPKNKYAKEETREQYLKAIKDNHKKQAQQMSKLEKEEEESKKEMKAQDKKLEEKGKRFQQKNLDEDRKALKKELDEVKKNNKQVEHDLQAKHEKKKAKKAAKKEAEAKE